MSLAGVNNLSHLDNEPFGNGSLSLVGPSNNLSRVRVDSTGRGTTTDVFEGTGERPVQEENQGFFSRLLRGIVSSARSAWRFVRQYNPYTQLLNLIEDSRCSRHIRNAASRNGAQTEEEVRQYHESLRFDEANPDETRLFKAHFPPGSERRPLVILFLGNSQTHSSPTEIAGVNELYNRLRRNNNVDIMIFRVGCASRELRHRFGLTSDCSLHTSVVFEHTSNVIEDIIRQRRPTSVTFAGYSFGGGTVDRLIRERWDRIGRGVPIVGTAYIDAIRLGSYDLGDPIQTRPPHSNRHLNFYQNDSNALNGSTLNGLQGGDITRRIPNVTHETIDNDERVLGAVYRFIRRTVIAR